MKKILTLFFGLFPFFIWAQGELGFYLEDIKVIPSDFSTQLERFNADNKESLHALREYIEAKEEELDEIDYKINQVERNRYVNSIDTTLVQQYLHIVSKADENKLIDGQIKNMLVNMGYMAHLYGEKKIIELSPITEKVRTKLEETQKNLGAWEKLRISRKNINDDINKAQLRIDHLYGQLYDEGKFKIWITIIFSCIVGALLILFFVFISRNTENNMTKDFLSSGNGLQFITLFSLIIAIILFGVLGVLEGRELAAILSGISGYILGKGISKPTDPLSKSNIKAPEA